jgi:hypothetical protein
MQAILKKSVLFITLISLSLGWIEASAARSVLVPGLQISAEDPTGLTLELTLPEFTFEQSEADGQPCQVLRVEGYGSLDTPGYPELPIRGFFAGIPPESTPELTIDSLSFPKTVGYFDICAAAQPLQESGVTYQPVDLGEIRLRDVTAYALDGFTPENPAELVMTGYLRSQRVAKVLFQPFQYNPVSRELRVYTHIEVRLSFDGAGKTAPYSNRNSGGLVNEGEFEHLLRSSLVNYEFARPMRSQPHPQLVDPTFSAVGGVSYPSYKIFVNQDGIYQVTYEDLVAAGAELSNPPVDPASFRLFRGGDYRLGLEVAIALEVDDKDAFRPGDSIIFYGQKVDTRYTDTNVYYLTWGAGIGQRMPVIEGAPGIAAVPESFLASVHYEENKTRFANHPSGWDEDVWYFNKYISAFPIPNSKYFYPTLTDPYASSTLTATLSGFLKGYRVSSQYPNPQHHIQIFFNDHIVKEAWWTNKQDYFFKVDFPQSYIQATNTIRIDRPPEEGITEDYVLVNWFEIDYWKTFIASNDRLDFSSTIPDAPAGAPGMNAPSAGDVRFQVSNFSVDSLEVYDVTDPDQTSRISPIQVVSDSGTYKLDFQESILGEHHFIAQSLSRRLSPLRISRDNLSNLRSDMNSADYLLITHSDFYTAVLPLAENRSDQDLHTLVIKVEDIYDEFSGGLITPVAIRSFLAYAYQYWQPPVPLYVLLVGDGNFDPRNYLGTNEQIYIPVYLAMVDPWDGERPTENRFVTVSGEDDLPDMYIGRLPARTSIEASAMVDKILAYQELPFDMTSSEWRTRVLFVAGQQDSAGDFDYFSNAVADHYVPGGYDIQKVYYQITHTHINDARNAIIEAINQGVLMVNFIGHGSVISWYASLSSGSIFSASSISSLEENARLPVMIPMTCLEGSFDYPSPPGSDNSSLAERLVREPHKGAIASFSPLGQGVASGHDFLNKGLYEAIFHYNLTRIGDATTQSKLYLFANSAGMYRDLIDTYALLGDPALRLGLVYQYMFPIIARDAIH